MNSNAMFLRHIEPFSCLPMADVECLGLFSQLVHHAKGEVIYNEGESADYVWVLKSGRAVSFQYQTDGKPLALDAVKPGQVLSPLDHLAKASSLYPCTALACVDSMSVRIPQRCVYSLYARQPALLSAVYDLCSQQLERMRHRLVELQEPVRQRIVRTLFDLKQSSNTIPFTKREISELAATTVETTIRVLSDFEKRNWVSSIRGRITLKDIPHLRSVLNLPPLDRALAVGSR